MQVGFRVSDGREGGTAEHAHSNGARQVAGLPAVAVPEVEGVQGLEVVRVGFQVHLAQELVFQDSVVPDPERCWPGSWGQGFLSMSSESRPPWPERVRKHTSRTLAFFFSFLILSFTYFWLCWVFIAARVFL